MSKKQLRFGNELQLMLQQVQNWLVCKRESQVTANKGGGRLMRAYVKFTLDHAWLELRNDQKWCGVSSTKDKVQSKRRKLDDQSAQSSTSVPGEDDQSAQPVGVKAAKAKAKRSVSKPNLEEGGREFQSMWEIRQKDFALKVKLNKQKLLDSLIAKTEPLTELEIALKNKLITDMLAS
ncbi:hypothetical protein Bca101_067620 [Brassica carinata]